jgi:hypothetical protein
LDDRIISVGGEISAPLRNICATNYSGHVPLVVNTYRSLSHSLPLIGFLSIVTQRVSLVEQELPIFPSSSTVLSGFRVTQSLDFSIIFCRSLFVILPFFLLAIVLSVLRITDSDNSFDIFKFFLRPPPYRNACTEPRR